MHTELKSFAVVGTVGYLAARHVFEATQRKAILYGILGGMAIVAALQLKLNVPGMTQPHVDKLNTPTTHPEVDNSGTTNTPENLPPISFNTGLPLNGNASVHLEDAAVTDWDIAWGDNPYKAQQPTITKKSV